MDNVNENIKVNTPKVRKRMKMTKKKAIIGFIFTLPFVIGF